MSIIPLYVCVTHVHKWATLDMLCWYVSELCWFHCLPRRFWKLLWQSDFRFNSCWPFPPYSVIQINTVESIWKGCYSGWSCLWGSPSRGKINMICKYHLTKRCWNLCIFGNQPKTVTVFVNGFHCMYHKVLSVHLCIEMRLFYHFVSDSNQGHPLLLSGSYIFFFVLCWAWMKWTSLLLTHFCINLI